MTTIPQADDDILAVETRAWLVERDGLMRQAAGKFVVIQGGRVFGIFDDSADAYARTPTRGRLRADAYARTPTRVPIRQFGNVPFLLRPIQWGEEVYSLGGSALGDDFTGEQEEQDAAPETYHP